jgi:hypothetical protein
MSDPSENWVTFVAEYEEGFKVTFRIDQWTLESGDHVCCIVARENQEKGLLKPGKIVLVYREEPLGWIKTSLGWLNKRAAPRALTLENFLARPIWRGQGPLN